MSSILDQSSSTHLQISALSVEIYSSATTLAKAAALSVRNYLHSLLSSQTQASIILATGNSQIEFLHHLTNFSDIPWSKIICFHLDEYLGIKADNPASFRYYLQHRFAKKVKPQNFNYLQGDALQPIAECERYRDLLQAQPIDLCLLGIGNNGHLAFNDPDVADFEDKYVVKLVKLDEKNRQQQFTQGHFSTLAQVPQYAFTLTLPTICSAKKIICLAPGESKAQIIKQVLEGEITTRCPASILRRQSQATLFLDRDSSSLSKNLILF
ncbi:MAG: glucosamine-6-phosphate deaminase [Cyanobacteria bacterium J083]|nr:MAG: glucosamine-6-phosphate deaminase [Cyanobacteria bacterium J083]